MDKLWNSLDNFREKYYNIGESEWTFFYFPASRNVFIYFLSKFGGCFFILKSARKILFSFFVLCLLFAGVGCGGEKAKLYSVSGRVTADGKGLAGVSVSYSGGSVCTDENGEFIIENLREATELKAEKEGYAFSPASVTVSSFAPSAEMEGFLCVDLVGRVESNGLPLEKAFVRARGLAGGSVYTDRFGMFVLSGVAGELTVSVEAEGYRFFDKVLAPGETEVRFDGVYRAQGKILQAGMPLAGVSVTDGVRTATTDENGAYTLEGVSAYAELRAQKAGYAFLPEVVTVMSEGDEADFAAYPTQTVSGRVYSGSVPLAGAEIRATFTPEGLTEQYFATAVSDEAGRYALEVFGEAALSCKFGAFEFESERRGEETDFSGSFPLSVRTEAGGEPLAGVEIGGVSTDEAGRANFQTTLGAVLLPVKAGYHAEPLTVTGTDSLAFVLQPIYDLHIEITFENEPFAGATLTLDGEPIASGTVAGLWGVHTLRAQAFGYRLGESDVFDARVDENACTFSLKADKYYSISGSVHSGELAVSGEIAAIGENGERAVAEVRSGAYRFENLIGARRLIFAAEGYSAAEVRVTHEDSICDLQAVYELHGVVTSGDLGIAGATVTATGADLDGNVTVTSGADGRFSLAGLAGRVQITATREGHTFDGEGVLEACDPYASLRFDGTYCMRGRVYVRVEDGRTESGAILYKEQRLAGVNIFGTCGTDVVENKISDEEGIFSYTDLRGKVVLHAYSSTERVTFKPADLNLTGAGDERDYSFEAGAYQIEGRVTSLGLPVAGVRLVTGERTVTTDAEGRYLFDVLKSLVTVTPEKEGYAFSPAQFTVTSQKDFVQDFECTYAVSGVVENGGAPLAGVRVEISGSDAVSETDSDGRYFLEGISGAQVLRLSREGYAFSGNFEVRGYDPDRNFESTYSVSGCVTSGGLAVGGVRVFRGGCETVTAADGTFVLAGLSGRGAIGFSKEGYTFRDSAEVSEYCTDLNASGTYAVSGRVTTGDLPVSGARVTVGGEMKQTGADGTFFFYGLSGETEVHCAKDGYTFGSTSVCGYESDLRLEGTYRYLLVVSGSAPIEGVRVRGFGREVFTDAEGKALLEGLSGSDTLTFEKAGYTIDPLFVGGTSGEAGRQVFAKFSVSGVVLTGDVPVSDVRVTCGGKSVTTNSRGKFSFDGLSGTVALTFEKEGYEFTGTGTFSEYVADLVVSSTYTLRGSVYCEDGGYGAVTVTAICGDRVQTKTPDSEGAYAFAGLIGETVLTFEREGYSFNYQTVKATEALTLEVNRCGVLYGVSGKVTAGGYAVAGMTVTAGALTATTDAEGKFRFASVVGATTVTAEIATKDLDGKSYSLKKQKLVHSESEIFFEFDQKEYALAAIYRAYETLRHTSFRAVLSGKAIPNVGGDQLASGITTRGKDGSLLLQNQNYGGVVNAVVVKVDPRVSQQIYIGADGKISFRKATGDALKEDLQQTTFGAWEEDRSKAELTAFDGPVEPTRFIGYGVTASTITIRSFRMTEGRLTVEISLDKDKGIVNYIQRMKKRSGQNITDFEFVNLTFDFDETGRIVSLGTNEKYNVSVGSFGGNATSTTTETFTYEDIETVARP